jgi:TIR domain
VTRPGAVGPAFISYRWATWPNGRAVHQALTAYGCDAFIDRDGNGAGPIGEMVFGQIANRPNFVVILTPGSPGRFHNPDDWVRREIACALRCRRTIVPLFFDGFEFRQDIPLPDDIAALRNYRPLHVRGDNFVDAMNGLCERYLWRFSAGPPAAAPPANDWAPAGPRRAVALVAQPAPRPPDVLTRREQGWMRQALDDALADRELLPFPAVYGVLVSAVPRIVEPDWCGPRDARSLVLEFLGEYSVSGAGVSAPPGTPQRRPPTDAPPGGPHAADPAASAGPPPPTRTAKTASGQAATGKATPSRTTPHPATSAKATPGKATPGQAATARATPDRATPGQAATAKAPTDKTTTGRATTSKPKTSAAQGTTARPGTDQPASRRPETKGKRPTPPADQRVPAQREPQPPARPKESRRRLEPQPADVTKAERALWRKFQHANPISLVDASQAIEKAAPALLQLTGGSLRQLAVLLRDHFQFVVVEIEGGRRHVVYKSAELTPAELEKGAQALEAALDTGEDPMSGTEAQRVLCGAIPRLSTVDWAGHGGLSAFIRDCYPERFDLRDIDGIRHVTRKRRRLFGLRRSG